MWKRFLIRHRWQLAGINFAEGRGFEPEMIYCLIISSSFNDLLKEVFEDFTPFSENLMATSSLWIRSSIDLIYTAAQISF